MRKKLAIYWNLEDALVTEDGDRLDGEFSSIEKVKKFLHQYGFLYEFKGVRFESSESYYDSLKKQVL